MMLKASPISVKVNQKNGLTMVEHFVILLESLASVDDIWGLSLQVKFSPLRWWSPARGVTSRVTSPYHARFPISKNTQASQINNTGWLMNIAIKCKFWILLTLDTKEEKIFPCWKGTILGIILKLFTKFHYFPKLIFKSISLHKYIEILIQTCFLFTLAI